MKLVRHGVVMAHISREISELSAHIFEKKNVLLVFTHQGLAFKLR